MTATSGDEESRALRTFARSNYNWPFESGPFYGEVNREPGVFVTSAGSFNIARGQLSIPEQLRTSVKLSSMGAQYFVLSLEPEALSNGTFESIRETIVANGGAVMKPATVASFIVRLTQASHAALQTQNSVIAIEPYHPAFKLHPSIGRAPMADSAKALADTYTLDLMVFKGEDVNVVAQTLTSLGANIHFAFPTRIRADVHWSKLAEVAALEPIQMISEYHQPFAAAAETTNAIQQRVYDENANSYQSIGVRGQGEAVMVLDSGLSLDVGEFSDTSTDAGTPGPAHRKVLTYQSVNAYGGLGDLLSCDDDGGITHGNTVSNTAVGWATEVEPAYGTPYTAEDDNGTDFSLDGVAPEAKLAFYDAYVNPTPDPCASRPGLSVGNLYTSPSGGSMGDAYTNHGVRVVNFSLGDSVNQYAGAAIDIDQFMFDNDDAIVFTSSGNDGADNDGDGVPDASTIGSFSNVKNGIAVGSTFNASDTGGFNADDRSGFTSIGPTEGGRVSPILMAPGQDGGAFGLTSEFNCVSADQDQNNPVQCIVVEGRSGTSFASPAVAGAAALIRSYLTQGFYPDGTDQNPGNASDQVANVSGALVKSILIASADWVGDGNNLPGGGFPLATLPYRFTNESGYGRVQLNNALPNPSYPSVVGLIVADGAIAGGANNTDLSGSIADNAVQSSTFEVCDDTQELRVALSWIESPDANLLNDLDLEVESPSGDIYFGNYFTDDNDRNGALDTGEDCVDPEGNVGDLSQSPWSLASCANSVRDTANPTEGVFLSPDPSLDGTGGDDTSGVDDSQIEAGQWTVRVRTDQGANTFAGTQDYAVAISGGVCLGSNIRFLSGTVGCNDLVSVVVNETDETDDAAAGLTPAEIAGRTTLQVVDPGNDGVLGTGDDVVVDSETPGAAAFSQDPGSLRFVLTDFVLSTGTEPQSGNGALDIQDGQQLRAIYADEASGSADPDQERTNTARVDCAIEIGFGDLNFVQFGQDGISLLEGGCERNARGKFEFGFPDRYMDAGESLGFRFAFSMNELEDMSNVQATLSCVVADADSPADCRPGTTDCADPNRENNAPCPYLTILDPVKSLGDIPATSAISANFSIQMNDTIAGEPEVDFLLGVSAAVSGQTGTGLAVSRQILDVDETELFYSTDFLTGGTEERDYNNDEEIVPAGQVTTNIGDFLTDYRFETTTWSDATANGKNAQLDLQGLTPFNFDSNDGGFTSGWGVITDDIGAQIVALWGEDKNFNNVLEAGEDRDPINGLLDQNWSLEGGCGWQTSNGGDRGVWHTGRIDTPNQANCLVTGATPGDCQGIETLVGNDGILSVFDILQSPVIEQVNDGLRIEHLDWQWNMAVDLPDNLSLLTWEMDTDTTTADVDLVADGSILNIFGGPYGAVTGGGNANLSDGYPVFAPLDGTQTTTQNGSVGVNRSGDNSCFFENGAVSSANAGQLGLSKPDDDDVDDDSAGGADDTLTDNGPIRNFTLEAFNGPDMRFSTLEDIYGDSGPSFQGAIGFLVAEGTEDEQPVTGFGAAVDDMVFQWKEIQLDPDTTACTGGACAVLELATTNFFEGSALLNITALDASPYGPDGVNDCNDDGDFTDPGDDTDCDDNGTADIVVKATSETELNGELVVLNNDGGFSYTGTLPISAAVNIPGTLFIAVQGNDAPTVTVTYDDLDDGTGAACDNDVDPAASGRVQVTTVVLFPVGNVIVQSFRLDDTTGSGDGDGVADPNEQVDMFITVSNKTGVDLEGIIARLSSADDNIDCILNPVVNIGNLAADAAVEGAAPFTFHVSDSVSRSTVGEELTAGLVVTMSSDQFDAIVAPQDITLDLDLNITGGAGPTNFLEGFEGGLGQFAPPVEIDQQGSNAASDGFRCQYNDPDFVNSNSYGETACFLGGVVPFLNGNEWQLDNLASRGSAARAYTGGASLHWGVFTPGDPTGALDTYRFGQLETIETANPINLDYSARAGAPNSELSFKHQISLLDTRAVNAGAGEAPDRAVVHVQLADSLTGNPLGSWIKVSPYQNPYDVQGTDNFVDCLFDPTDDGNTEDTFFDPSDPDRRLGPSSTCAPEFSFGFQGNTTPTQFNATALGRAADGPGLDGATGGGTWIESIFDLSRFQGRRLRLRFVTTTIELDGAVQTVQEAFGFNPNPADDGWWIDDVSVSNTLITAANVAVDNGSNLDPNPCLNAACTAVTADLVADPLALPAPGHATELTAVASSADTCVDGTLQFRFYNDNNANGSFDDGLDTLLRDWTDNASIVAAPGGSGDIGVSVRCSSLPSCADDASVTVTVACPSTGTLSDFNETITATDKNTFSWATSQLVAFARGDLDAVRAGGTFVGTVDSFTNEFNSRDSIVDTTTPAPGASLYWLVRRNACNAGGSWDAGGAPDRDTQLP
ncbi:hypothetical protein ABI59_00040 [Acidobacteria bacterium Mor1]|nr:hypothetical protein ABI59_00040 [Acidobacteria bacterium Mor1]